MFDKLIDILVQFSSNLVPFTIIPTYQAAGVLRCGRYNRTLGAGFHWKVPFFEDVHTENVYTTTMRFLPQTCVTKDRKTIVVTGMIRYRIVDVKPYICEVGDPHDVVMDVGMGAILSHIRDRTFDELIDTPPESKIASVIRRQAGTFGFEIISFTFIDIGLTRSLRLITDANLFSSHLL